jgi:hypothetical protein
MYKLTSYNFIQKLCEISYIFAKKTSKVELYER